MARQIKGSCSILSMDFKKVDEDMDRWEEQRLKKGEIYKAFSEYVICLENSLEHEEDSYQRYLLEEEIKKMKKEQKKYYVPSILGAVKLDPIHGYNDVEDNESYLQMATRGIKKSTWLTAFVKKLKK